MEHSAPVLSEAWSSALTELSTKLASLPHPWAITGSLGFYLQGVPVALHDVDIQTDQLGACAIENHLGAAMTHSVAFRSTSRIRSHFGRAILFGVSVEIMGAIERSDASGVWQPAPDLETLRHWVPWHDRQWPVLDLHYEAIAYRQLGRAERAAHSGPGCMTAPNPDVAMRAI